MFRIVFATLAVLAFAACSPKPIDNAEATSPPAAAVAPASTEQSAADATWAALEDKYLTMPEPPAIPIEELEWREVHCNFLGGEIAGDPEQDKAVNARIEAIGCGRQREDGLALKAASAGDAALIARIDAFLSRHPT